MKVGQVQSTLAGGRVTLTGSQILDGGDGDGPDVVAPKVVLDTTAGVGSSGDPLDTDADNLEAEGGTGGIWIRNAGALTIGGVGAMVGLDAGQAIVVTATSPLTIAENVTSASSITLTASESAGPGDHLAVAAGVTIRSTGSTITLRGGDNVSVAAGALVDASGTVTLQGDFGDAEAAGSTIEVYGQLGGSSNLVQGGDDGDVIVVTNVKAGSPTTVQAGGGTDTIRVGNQASPAGNSGGNVNAIAALLTIDAGTSASDADQVTVDETGEPGGSTGALTSSTIAGLGMGGSIAYENVETLTVSLGGGGDTFTIESTHGGTTTLDTGGGVDAVHVRTIAGATTVNAGSGADTIDVSSTAGLAGAGTLDGIDATLTVNGDGDAIDTLDVSDSGHTAGRTGGAAAVLTATMLSGLGMGGQIVYATVEALHVTLGSGGDAFTIQGTHPSTATTLDAAGGADTVNVQAISGTTTVNGGDGADTINVSGAGGTLAGIQASLAVNGDADADTVNVSLAGDDTVRSGNLTETDITGLGMGPAGVIQYDTETLDLTLGQASDHLQIVSTHGGATNVHAGPGQDVVNIEDVAGTLGVHGDDNADQLFLFPGGDGVAAPGAFVLLDGGAGDDEIELTLAGTTGVQAQVDDGSAGVGADTLTVLGTDGADLITLDAGDQETDGLTAGVVLAGAAGAGEERVDYRLMDSLVVDTGAGADTLTVRDNAVATEIFMGEGEDDITIGIVTETLVFDEALEDFVPVVESATSGTSAVMTVRGGGDDDKFDINHNQAELFLFGDAGDDTFIINTFLVLRDTVGDVINTTNVTGGEGADEYEYLENAPVTIDGGDGFDTIVINGTAIRDVFVVTDLFVVGAGRQVFFTNVERIEINGSGGDDEIFVVATNPALDIVIAGDVGSDTVHVGGDPLPVRINLPPYTYQPEGFTLTTTVTQEIGVVHDPAPYRAVVSIFDLTFFPSQLEARLGGPIVAVHRYLGFFNFLRLPHRAVLRGRHRRSAVVHRADDRDDHRDRDGHAGPGRDRPAAVLRGPDGAVRAHRDPGPAHREGRHPAGGRRPSDRPQRGARRCGGQRRHPDGLRDHGPRHGGHRGTTAETNVDAAGGDDTVNVSSDAPGQTGTVDTLLGTLHVEAGGGSNTLHVSDIADATADGTATAPVVITDQSITGLSPAVIHYVATGGTYAGGVTIEGGSGGNTIEVRSTRDTAGVREITIVDAGQGADRVTVTETDPAFLVVNGQAGDDLIDAAAATTPVTLFGGSGDDTATGGSAADVIFGDGGRVVYDGTPDIVLGATGAESSIANPTPGDTPESITTVAGEGDDLITGNAGDDIVLGGLGNDEVHGNAGADVLVGDTGALALVGGVVTQVLTLDAATGGNDTVTGDDGDDRLLGGSGADTIDGHAGADLILGDGGRLDSSVTGDLLTIASVASGLGGADVIHGHDGIDTVLGGAAGDEIHGDEGDDLLLGDEGEIHLFGGIRQQIASTAEAIGGIDTVAGDEDDDVVLGGAFGDVLHGNDGADVLLGDSGQLDYSATGNLLTVASTAPGVGGADTITGDAGGDIVVGGAEGDEIHGNVGADVLLGDEGEVHLLGGDRQQIVSTNPAIGGIDTITGDEDEDVIVGGAGGDVLHGNAGHDLVFGDSAQLDYSATGDLPTAASTASGIGGADTITGDEGDDAIVGGAFGDDLHGNAGDDLIFGDEAEIHLVGGVRQQAFSTNPATGGIDTITGDEDEDVIVGGAEGDVLHGNAGHDLVFGDSGQLDYSATGDLLTAASTASGIGGADTITGDDGGDVIAGGAAGDDLHGNAGDDLVLGDEGRITLLLGVRQQAVSTNEATGGIDTIAGDADDDVVVGGAKSDVVRGNDVMNADDNLDTNGGANDAPDDPLYADADSVFGGEGRDTLAANTGADRLIDWTGEFNAYVVPFSPFGAGTITRAASPQIVDFVLALGESDGADQTRSGSVPSENDLYGELGLVTRGQTGGPSDPQPGNGKAKKDTR